MCLYQLTYLKFGLQSANLPESTELAQSLQNTISFCEVRTNNDQQGMSRYHPYPASSLRWEVLLSCTQLF